MTARTLPLGLGAVLRVDAVASGLVGALAAAGAPVLDGVLGIRVGVLLAAGLFLLAFAVLVWRVAAAGRPPAARAVVAVNVAWVLASLLAAGGADLPALGRAVVAGQGLAVAALTALQVVALRHRAVP